MAQIIDGSRKKKRNEFSRCWSEPTWIMWYILALHWSNIKNFDAFFITWAEITESRFKDGFPYGTMGDIRSHMIKHEYLVRKNKNSDLYGLSVKGLNWIERGANVLRLQVARMHEHSGLDFLSVSAESPDVPHLNIGPDGALDMILHLVNLIRKETKIKSLTDVIDNPNDYLNEIPFWKI